ncbi:MFS transporter [Azoarcus sp. KH32C]|uniref:MFS transporter n=1 Tax=Azoarcus sp. KH32C TaxID=748247 RepID=UPI0002386C5C|nr:MFS transporter [Azoarcus sp. KH32C]BAL24353.1 hypothetical protein AZKH_2040 [Azoarcus sp. KH32C]
MLRAIAAVTSIEFLETGMVTFAAGPIMSGLGARPDAFALSFTVYAVGAIFMLYKHQWMVERYGYRNFTLGSLLLFAIGAVLCATASGIGQFTVGRALQGAAGATFFTAGRIEVNRVPPERLFYGVLAFIASLLSATALAPLASALLTDTFGWRALFWAVVPLCMAVALVAGPHLSRSTAPAHERSREHWGWVLILASALLCLQYALQEMQFGLLAHPLRVVAFALPACLILTAFAWRQWHRDRPLIDYRALLHWRYALGIVLYFIGYFMAGSSGFLLPIFAEQALGLPTLTTGAVLTVAFLTGLAAALVHAFMFRRWPRLRPYMLVGLAFCFLGWSLLALLDAGAGWTALLLPAALGAASSAFFFGPVAFGTFVEVDQKAFSHAYQVKNIVRQLGLSSAVAASAAILQWRFAERLGDAAPSADAPAAAELMHHVLGNAGSGETAHIASQALFAASNDTFIGFALLVVPVALLVWRQRIFH